MAEGEAKRKFDASKIKKSIQQALSGKGGIGVDERGELVYPTRAEAAAAKAELEKPGGLVKNRARLGIRGLDALIPDGVPANSVILVAGATGTGKTLLGLQFLVAGALRGEPGLFISFEEDLESIRKSGRSFGWDIDRLEAEKKLLLAYKDPSELKEFSKTLAGELHYSMVDMGVKRVVIDSLTYFAMTIPNDFQVRQEVAALAKRLRSVGCMTMMTAELPEQPEPGHLYVENFVADGVVFLYNLLVRDSRRRAVEVLKMRNSRHDSALHPLAVTENGIEIYPEEQVFKE